MTSKGFYKDYITSNYGHRTSEADFSDALAIWTTGINQFIIGLKPEYQQEQYIRFTKVLFVFFALEKSHYGERIKKYLSKYAPSYFSQLVEITLADDGEAYQILSDIIDYDFSDMPDMIGRPEAWSPSILAGATNYLSLRDAGAFTGFLCGHGLPYLNDVLYKSIESAQQFIESR